MTVIERRLRGSVRLGGVAVPCRITVDGVAARGSGLGPDGAVLSAFLPVDLELGDHERLVTLQFSDVDEWLSATKRGRGRWRSGLLGEQRLRWLRTSLLGRADYLSAPGVEPLTGLWKPVQRNDGGLAAAYLTADPASGTISVRLPTQDPAERPATLTVTGPDGEQYRGTLAGGTAAVTIAQPQLWWPRGYGPQPLYEVRVQVGAAALTREVGFRTVTFDPDGAGLTVNGVRVFARGAVWLPGGSPTDLRTLAAAGATMVRIPGGTAPEQQWFYRDCARLGLLLWHDAMLATFDPPAELDDTVLAEVEALLTELSGNPALAVLSGGSETLQQPEMLGLDAERRSIPLLDRIAARGYANNIGAVPNSPWSPGADLAIAPHVGVAHWFGVGGYRQPLASVRDAAVRFAAECLAFAIPADDTTPGVGVPRDRGADWDFADVRDRYVREIFGIDPAATREQDPQRYLEMGRCAVAAAMDACFTHWRLPASGCGGALVLAARDLQPGSGWGLIDSAGHSKSALRALRRRWAPLGLDLTAAGLAGLRITVHNDTPAAVAGTLDLVAVNDAGITTVRGSLDVAVAGRGHLTVHDPAVTGYFSDLTHAYGFGAPVAAAVRVTLLVDGAVQAREALALRPEPPREIPDPGLQLETSHRGDAWQVRVTAATTLRFVTISAPGYDPGDDYFTLLAGDSHTVTLHPHPGTSTPPVVTVRSIDTAAAAQTAPQ